MVVLISAISSSGCVGVAPRAAIPTIPVADQRVIPGRQYEINVIRPTDGARISYLGKVADANTKSVVFDGALKRVDVANSPPIPLVGKMFLNKSVATQNLDGEVRIDRDEITAIRDKSTAGDEPSLPSSE